MMVLKLRLTSVVLYEITWLNLFFDDKKEKNLLYQANTTCIKPHMQYWKSNNTQHQLSKLLMFCVICLEIFHKTLHQIW